MLASENRIRELAQVIEQVNARADAKIAEMKTFVTEVGGRFDQLEKALPERIHNLENRQEAFIGTINQLTKHIQDKFVEIEAEIRGRPRGPPSPPSFEGPRAFNIGSPMPSQPTQQPTDQPQEDPWAAFARSRTAHGGLSQSVNSNAPTPAPSNAVPGAPPANIAQNFAGPRRPWDPKLWSIADAKVSKELKPFNGTHSTYKIWANRVKDHFIKKNSDWNYVFAEVEKQRTPIARDLLKNNWLMADGAAIDVDFAWCSNTLWTFIGEHVADSIYNNRNVLAGGHNNGLELWRSLFVKHEGGADQVELGGMESLHTFPKCDKVESLQFWIGKWNEVKEAYGSGISDAHLRSMFINILPPTVQKDVRENRDLNTLQRCIDHVLSDLGRLNDAQLSKMHSDRLRQSLSSTQRISPVLEYEERQEQPSQPKPDDQMKDLINALSSKMENMVAAAVARPKARAQPKRAQSDFAKFGDRCLHCGSDKHRARDCPVKKSLIEKNGGKLPVGYKSAFDKWREKQTKPVAPLVDVEDVEDMDEFSETDLEPVWCLPQCAITESHACRVCDPPSFEHPNSFAAIFDGIEDDEDDESVILDAIKQISSKVTIGPRKSQKERKRSLDKRSISQIARLVKAGKLNLPQLDLESNEDYEAIWALVDSGAAKSCARRKGHFGNTVTHLRPSSVKMATASGEELKSRGCFQITALSAEGNEVTQTFEDADVDMPIMSVGEISANGDKGSNVLFGEHDGHLIDIKTSATSKFYRRRGVYFMKLYVPRNKSADPDFVRPGAA